MFAGGSHPEVTRWLRNFLTAHAKRVSPRVEVLLDAGDERAESRYRARLRLDERTSDALELEYPEVARNRASLAWCTALAERVAGLARTLVAGRGSADARAR